ncbi:MAG: galactokinase [Granulosicoccus sp.]
MPERCPATTELHALSLDILVDKCIQQARRVASRSSDPCVVVSPYRFNPLGAHIDHQGGQVLARCLDQYTILCFWPRHDGDFTIHSSINNAQWECTSFKAHQLQDDFGWDSMVRASATAYSSEYELQNGYEAVVFGTLVSSGLSSSASVILAYLTALAFVNDIELSAQQLVELVRCVENDYRGLNNGVQDQMSIVFARRKSIALLDVASVSASTITDPPNSSQVTFLMCYSGVSRNLVTGSNFNQRVSECRDAAGLLCDSARHLGEVPEALRTEAALAGLPEISRRRASHVFGEMQRVQQGCAAWKNGNWQVFGQLMSQSCQSSISNYESGSPWLIDLHEMASNIEGVFGSRFSGGGYGGCLFMLVENDKVATVANQLSSKFLGKYPELSALARVQIAQSESTIRVLSS